MSVAPAPLVAPRTDTSAEGLRAAVVDDLIANGLRRRAIPGEEAVRRPDLAAYRCDLLSPEVNEVAFAAFGDGEAADEAVAETLRLFGARPFFWWLGPDSGPADLAARLERHGVRYLEDIPAMAMVLDDLAPLDATGGEGGTGAAALRVEPVVDPAGIRAFHDVLAHGFPEDFVDRATTDAIVVATERVAAETNHREPIGVPTRWVGWIGDRPVCSTRLHTGAGVAGIYAVVTVPDARRRGFGETITRVALGAARAAGLPIGTLQASDEGRRVYERIGFREVVRYRLHEWQPSATQ